MANLGAITIKARLLQEALAVAVPKRRKNSRRRKSWPLTLRLDEASGNLHVFEANHALKGYEVPAQGSWPDQVQVDGHMLRQIADKYEPSGEISLIATESDLAMEMKASRVVLPRLDGGGRTGVALRPIPQDPRHTGPVEIAPDPKESGTSGAIHGRSAHGFPFRSIGNPKNDDGMQKNPEFCLSAA